jgi:uncharacterized protein YndB with AHSA1/START domain
MIRIKNSTQIGRPRDEVFDFLTSIDNLPKWQGNVVHAASLSDGPVRIGFQFEQTIKMGPRKMRAVCTITDIKANERFGFSMKSSGPVDCDARFELQPVVGGTRLTMNGVARLKGLWRLLQPIVGGELRKETRAELATMKLLLEAAAGVPSLVTT